jgi:transcriptional regulator with XRE-family HTH domain
MAKSFGNVLRHCRGSAGLSQMALALEAGISARHLSFLESGRAAPGRGVVAKLAAALRLAETARNALFASAGFAPLPGREEDRPERAEALARLIQNFDPHPSALAGPGGRICVVNRGMQALHAALTGSHAELGGMTAAELALGPSGLGPFLTNRDELARRFTHCNALLDLIAGAVSAASAPSADQPVPNKMRFAGDYGALAFDLVELSEGRLFQGGQQSYRIYTMAPCDRATEAALTAIIRRLEVQTPGAALAEPAI